MLKKFQIIVLDLDVSHLLGFWIKKSSGFVKFWMTCYYFFMLYWWEKTSSKRIYNQLVTLKTKKENLLIFHQVYFDYEGHYRVMFSLNLLVNEGFFIVMLGLILLANEKKTVVVSPNPAIIIWSQHKFAEDFKIWNTSMVHLNDCVSQDCWKIFIEYCIAQACTKRHVKVCNSKLTSKHPECM